ncbi:MAG: PDZ domain-containing protein [Myxococcales bacterium]|nr:MAG: PDZ domain-containing protein [Myxococcales bacterium]
MSGQKSSIWAFFWGFAAALTSACGPSVPGSIGVALGRMSSGSLEVRQAPDDMTGAQAGLRPGDEVVAIDGVDARGLSDEEVHRRLQGPLGSRVALTVVREGKVMPLSVMRGPYRSGAPKR